MATAADVAQWMLDELKRTKELCQDDAAYGIVQKFGDDFVYYSDFTGGLCIDKRALEAFRKISGDRVVWERSLKAWRLRDAGDPRRQA